MRRDRCPECGQDIPLPEWVQLIYSSIILSFIIGYFLSPPLSEIADMIIAQWDAMCTWLSGAWRP